MKVVEKHSLWLRIIHWLNVPLLSLMLWSGLLIYWANDEYAPFFPEWFYKFFNLSSRLAQGISIHFFVVWFFIANSVLYLVYIFISGHWRDLFPNRDTFKHLGPTILHDLGLAKEMPHQGKFNAAQRIAYTGAFVLGIIAVSSGFAIYKPVQLTWLTSCFGGYRNARFVHFIVMLSFFVFIALHLLQVLRAGWNNFRAMVAGFEIEGKGDAKTWKRTVRSFCVFVAAIVCVVLAWTCLLDQPLIDELPQPFRQVLEWNGKIWGRYFNEHRLSTTTNAMTNIPRSNGDIGLGGDISNWRMQVIADDQDPKSAHFSLSMKEILALPKTSMNTQFRCIEGWSENMSFAGVKFSDFMKAYKLPQYPYVGLESVDGAYYVSIDMKSMMQEQTLLAFEMNGKPLLPQNGAPLRLAIPTKYGVKQLKKIGKIFLSKRRPRDYWEEQGYDWYSGL